MEHGITHTSFNFPHQKSYYKGKVRDVYTLENDILVIIATDRLSAFDVVLPRPIPYKGQVLNLMASKFLKATEDIVPNWLLSVPDPNVSIGYKCQPYPLEIVVRGYLSGHAWREYKEGVRLICGVHLPDGLRENDRLSHPIITPSTKAVQGHDINISKKEIVRQGLVSSKEYMQIETVALALYNRGQALAKSRGLILVDTKYEFGKRDNTLCLIDEIHTPDSSRYFYSAGYEDRQETGDSQPSLSKEFVRQWLMNEGFCGQENQRIPVMSDEKVLEISQLYRDLYQIITGESLYVNPSEKDPLLRIQNNINQELEKIQFNV